eukprot:TRINITY_DN55846_c0_g1_i1.p1 TRINITY_DN55846_c0_g1~~TRINITY_DN55846_c0_g1_i1.p1  ORF type:complete len:171 (-),score=26.90 TRINITY_DN55846_c0_g1_i1:60-536(-)
MDVDGARTTTRGAERGTRLARDESATASLPADRKAEMLMQESTHTRESTVGLVQQFALTLVQQNPDVEVIKLQPVYDAFALLKFLGARKLPKMQDKRRFKAVADILLQSAPPAETPGNETERITEAARTRKRSRSVSKVGVNRAFPKRRLRVKVIAGN